MRRPAWIAAIAALAGCGLSSLPETEDFDAARSAVFDAATENDMGLGSYLVSNMGARRIYRLTLPAGDLIAEREGDEELEIEVRTRRPEYIVFATTIDGDATEYRLRLDFETIADDRTRVSVTSEADGPAADDPQVRSRMQRATDAQAGAIFGEIRRNLES